MNIEEYLKNHDADIREPDAESIWQGMSEKRKKIKVIRFRIIKGVAAVLFLAIFVGSLVRHEAIVEEQISSLTQISKELAEKEQSYNQQVSQKWTKYTNMPGNDSPFAPELLDELKSLDTLYQNGIEDMQTHGYNERATILLLKTYEKRLRIIEQLIYEKQKQVNYESKNTKIEL